MAIDLTALKGATIALDLDGTLVDTAPDAVGALATLMAEEGLVGPPLAVGRLMIGHGARVMVERGFAMAGVVLAGEPLTAMTERFGALYFGRIAHESLPYPGCLETLDQLSEAGAILAVCTNKRTVWARVILDALGMTDRFAAVIGADIAPAAKPDARHLIHTVETAGGELTRAILVGDSENDVYAARAAGTPSVFVTFGYCEFAVADLKPDAVIDSYAELPPVCARLLQGRLLGA